MKYDNPYLRMLVLYTGPASLSTADRH